MHGVSIAQLMVKWKQNFACKNNFKEKKKTVRIEFCLIDSAKLYPCILERKPTI